ncbi:MAG: GH3 auxin-responsive promoter family protein [Planctomycetota bacterium]
MRQVQRALRDPAAAQERLLLDLVRKARKTEWGRRHDFGAIRSAKEFQRAVPLNRYEDLAPLWHRAFDGDRDVTWPGHIKYFALSSGTTAGDSKALPVSADAIQRNLRAGATLVALCERQAGDGALTRGNVLYLGGCTELERRGACWQGDASGINAANIPRWVRRHRLPAPDVAAIKDWEARVDAICDRHLDTPVRAIVGLPSWTLILFHRLLDAARERHGSAARTVADVWPRLGAFVNFGMAFEPYRDQFEELVGRPIPVIDTYSSSEGGLNAVQSEQGDPGMLLELDTTAFYEFVLPDELEGDGPTRLTLGQVETDVDYALLLSTPSGIWSYDVGDVVRFTSLDPPKLVVTGRTRLALNVFGEHVIQENVEEALVAAREAVGAEVTEFTVGTEPPSSGDPRGRHVWMVEFARDVPPLGRFAAELDDRLARQSLDYKTHRDGDISMLAPAVEAVEPGTFYEWARRHGALGGQHKVPHIARSGEMIDELRRISAELAGR